MGVPEPIEYSSYGAGKLVMEQGNICSGCHKLGQTSRKTALCLSTLKGLECVGYLTIPGRDKTAVPQLSNTSQGGSGPGKESREAPSGDLGA